MSLETIAKQLAQLIKDNDKKTPKAYDTQATVTRIEGSTAWVHIAGGIDETPVKRTISCQAGDNVQVRVSGGRAWITGNATAPPTDDRQANIATKKAELADKKVVMAQETADTAKKIAGDTNQYFWHTESGTDTGAHITEKTQEEFLDDPQNGGGNLLMRSNGLAVRDGLTELATFSGTGLTVNDSDGAPVASLTNTGSTIGKNVSGQSRMVTSGTGMQFIRKDGSTDTVLAHIGYGDGATASGGTSKAPYYSIGLRKSGSVIGNYSMAEGINTIASGYSSHAEGSSTTASGWCSHTEGIFTTASGQISHAEGSSTTASEKFAHAEGCETIASGQCSHAGGYYTVAGYSNQTAIGKYNDNKTDTAFEIGNGTADDARSNAFAVDWNGKVWHSGDGQHNIASYVQTSKGTFVSGYIVVYGKVAQLNFTFRNTSSIAGGATLYEGTLSSNSGWLPKQVARGIGYLGPTPFIMTIGAGGGIIVQNASQATVIIPSNKSAYCTVTYIMA